MNKISRVYNTPALNKKRNLYEYISGFVDGEGCFSTHSLSSSKNKDFKIFKQICLKMAKGDHKKAKGLSKIVSSAFQMNPGGKRKYKQEEILGALR